MRVRAVFRTDLLHPIGAALQGGADLVPIRAEVQGALVRVLPSVEERTDIEDFGDGQIQRLTRPYLIALDAELEREIELGEWTTDLYESFRKPAAEVLRRTLSHLRVITKDWNVDATLTSVRLVGFYDEGGEQLPSP